ncbi:flavin reductase family protein [Tsukamurella soli]
MTSLYPSADIVDQLNTVGAGDRTLIRSAFGCFPSGVAAVSAITDGYGPAVLIVSSFQVGISMDPPLVLFAVQRTSASWPHLRTTPRLGISVLAATHRDTARRLATRGPDRFEGSDMVTTPTGAHLVRGASLWLETSVHAEVPAGDHDVILLEVHGIATLPDSDPLVWQGSSFRALTQRRREES